MLEISGLAAATGGQCAWCVQALLSSVVVTRVGGEGSKELHELMDGRLKEGRPCLILLPALTGHGPDGSLQVRTWCWWW
jgi:hypothetical protein